MNQDDKKSLYTWYEIGSVVDWIARQLPQLTKSEIVLVGKPIDVLIVEDEVIPSYSIMKMAIVYDEAFLPVYENGDLFITHDNNHASIKIDGVAYFGVLSDES